MPLLIAPSLLSANFAKLESEIHWINNSKADWLHLDIMDGVFVPNISFGLPVIKSIKPLCSKPFDVHLMIVNPDKYIKDFKEAGADILTVHYEACTHLHRTIQAIKQEGMQAGVAINPHTSVNLLEDVLADIDLVCVMSVNPGFGGQKFIERTFEKVQELKNLIEKTHSKALIEIDGGVTNENAGKLVSCGANVLVAGNYVFKAESPEGNIALLKNIK